MPRWTTSSRSSSSPSSRYLPAPPDRLDRRARGQRCRRELRRRVAPCLDDPAPDHERLELPPHGLDLGQLRHAEQHASALDGVPQPGAATAVAEAVTVVPSDAPGIARANT